MGEVAFLCLSTTSWRHRTHSQRSPFGIWSCHIGTAAGFSANISIFPYQSYSTNTQYSSITTLELCNQLEWPAQYHNLTPRLGLHLWSDTWLDSSLRRYLYLKAYSCLDDHVRNAYGRKEKTVEGLFIRWPTPVVKTSMDDDLRKLNVKIQTSIRNSEKSCHSTHCWPL